MKAPEKKHPHPMQKHLDTIKNSLGEIEKFIASQSQEGKGPQDTGPMPGTSPLGGMAR